MRRRVVERTFGWLMHLRRLARDYETHSHRSDQAESGDARSLGQVLLPTGPTLTAWGKGP
jgi:transposase